jgi:hypothetical protein
MVCTTRTDSNRSFSERLQARGGEVVVGQEAFAVDALDLGPHPVAELLGDDHSHRSGTLALRERRFQEESLRRWHVSLQLTLSQSEN